MLELLQGQKWQRQLLCRADEQISSGRQVFVIVPEQNVLLTERVFADGIPAEKSLSYSVLSFTRLANLVFRKYGGLAYNYAGGGVRAAIMYKALADLSPLLTEFTGEVDETLVESMLSISKETKTYGVSPFLLDKAAGEIDNPPLSKKLCDISKIISVFDALLTEKYDDCMCDLDRLSEILSDENFFENSSVFIDGFTSYTKQEFDIVKRIITGADFVCVTLPACENKAQNIPFAESERTKKIICDFAKENSVEIKETFTFEKSAPPEIVFAGDNIFDFSNQECRYDGDVSAVKTFTVKNAYECARVISSDIARRITDGAAYSDFAVIARSPDKYLGILDSEFELHKIPYFVSTHIGIETLPLVKLIFSALSLIIYDFRQDDVISYIKTGLCKISFDECDLFEIYTSKWNINSRARYLGDVKWQMNPRGFVDSDNESDAEELDRIHEIREKFAKPLSRLCDSFSEVTNIKRACAAIYSFMYDLGVADTISESAKSLKTKSSLDTLNLYNAIIDALDALSDCMPDFECNAEKFLRLLKIYFAYIEIGKIPTSADEVIIAGAGAIRNQHAKHVYIIGANEGEFPAAPASANILSDSEREILSQHGISMSPDFEIRSSNELFYFRRAICLAEKSLAVFCNSFEVSGAVLSPSVGFVRLEKIFGGRTRAFAYNSIENIYDTASAKQYYQSANETEKTIIKAALEKRGILPPPDAKSVENASLSISKDFANELWGKKITLTQSRIDRFQNCRLSFFCTHMLKLSEKSKYDFRAADIGTFVHSALEKFFLKIREGGNSIQTLTDEDIEKLSSEICGEYSRRVYRAQEKSSAKMAHLFSKLERLTTLILKNLKSEFMQSDFAPALFEYAIGLGEGTHTPLEFATEDGCVVSLCGIVDRIDAYRRGDDVYLRVVDYKTGGKDFKIDEISSGKNLQLLIYLMTLISVPDKGLYNALGVPENGKLLPAGVLYSWAKPPLSEYSDMPSEEQINADANLALRRVGLLINDEDILLRMERDLGKKYIPVSKNKDGEIKGSVCTENDFENIFTRVKEVIVEIATQIKSGDAAAQTSDYSSNSPCAYCKMKPICRSEKGGK